MKNICPEEQLFLNNVFCLHYFLFNVSKYLDISRTWSIPNACVWFCDYTSKILIKCIILETRHRLRNEHCPYPRRLLPPFLLSSSSYLLGNHYADICDDYVMIFVFSFIKPMLTTIQYILIFKFPMNRIIVYIVFDNRLLSLAVRIVKFSVAIYVAITHLFSLFYSIHMYEETIT